MPLQLSYRANLHRMFHTKVYVAGLLVTLNFRSTPGATSIGQSYESNVIVSPYDHSLTITVRYTVLMILV